MSPVDFDKAYASAALAHAHEKNCTTTGTARILFDAKKADGKSLKIWCEKNAGKCISEKPKFKGSSSGIAELVFPGGGHDKGCVFKKDAAHEAFRKSIKRQGGSASISTSTSI